MTRVLAILLDAASPDLIEKWTDDGSLPNLKRLRQQGAYGRLDSAEWLSEATLYVPHGQIPAQPPWLDIRSGMEHAEPHTWRIGAFVPFWRAFRGAARAVVWIRQCLRARAIQVEIIGWASHDALAPFERIRRNWRQHRKRLARAPARRAGPMTKREFMATVV
jgi:hypothetical protein